MPKKKANSHHKSTSFHLKLVKRLLSEADGQDELYDGRELVQVKMVATCQVSKGSVKRGAGTVVQSL